MNSDLPLTRIAASYIIEVDPNASEDSINSGAEELTDLLNNIQLYPEIKESMLEKFGSSSPAEKIYAIATVDTSRVSQEGPELESKPEKGRRKARPWSADEDLRLLKGIHKFGLDNWGEVVKMVGNGRTRPQCSQRWYRGIDPKINKQAWTPEEDEQLFKLVEEMGTKVWSKIAAEMGSRSDVQCRYHYFQTIKSSKYHDKLSKNTPSKPTKSPIQKKKKEEPKQTKEQENLFKTSPIIPSNSIFSVHATDLTEESPKAGKETSTLFPGLELLADPFEALNLFNNTFIASTLEEDFFL